MKIKLFAGSSLLTLFLIALGSYPVKVHAAAEDCGLNPQGRGTCEGIYQNGYLIGTKCINEYTNPDVACGPTP